MTPREAELARRASWRVECSALSTENWQRSDVLCRDYSSDGTARLDIERWSQSAPHMRYRVISNQSLEVAQ